MVLGLDASTSTVGWAFTQDSVIHSAGFINIKNFDSSKDKTLEVIGVLEAHPCFSKIEKIHLEAALSGFAGGFTSQQVIIKLSRFNAVFEYILSERWHKPIKLWNVNTARKSVLGKCREKGIKSKVFVKMYLEKIHDIHKFDTLNKKGNWDEKNSDMYDAMVLALAKDNLN
jgi:hypothetical protein